MILLLRQKLALTLLLYLTQFHFVKSELPMLIPDASNITIDAGGTLELECTGNEPIHFIYHETKKQLHVSYEVTEMDKNNRTEHRGKLILLNITSHDVGFYGCSNNASNDEKNTGISWIYVFVRTPIPTFVPISRREMVVYTGDDVVIPCRPSYEYPVTLSKLLKKVKRDRANFDSRVGFRMKNVTLQDHGYYKCKFTGVTAVFDFFLIVINKFSHEIATSPNYATLNRKNFEIFCDVIVKDAPANFNLTWSTPYGDIPTNGSIQDRISSRSSVSSSAYVTIMSNNLKIQHINQSDEGNYVCRYSSSTRGSVAHIDIKVYDSEDFTVTIIPLRTTTYARYGEKITLQATVEAQGHPADHVTSIWRDPKGNQIFPSEKYEMIRENNLVKLGIKNIQPADMGQYHLLLIDKNGCITSQKFNVKYLSV